MQSMLRLLFSILLSASSLGATAQFRDTTWVRDWNPSFVRIGVDASRGIDNLLSPYRTSVEGMIEFDTDQYFIIAEAGRVNTNRFHNDYSYLMEGNFFRVGIEKNILKYDTTRNVFSVGMRYARAGFSDQILFVDESPVFGAREVLRQNPNLNASWWELTATLKVKMWQNLYMGYVVRIKTGKNLEDYGQLVPYDIPGFGRNRKNATTDKPTAVSLNYYIYWTIPFREKTVPIKVRR